MYSLEVLRLPAIGRSALVHHDVAPWVADPSSLLQSSFLPNERVIMNFKTLSKSFYSLNIPKWLCKRPFCVGHDAILCSGAHNFHVLAPIFDPSVAMDFFLCCRWNWPIICLYWLISRGGINIYHYHWGMLLWLFISYSLIQRSKSHCIKEGQNVDAQKLFASMVPSPYCTNSSHFLIPLTLIFWPTWSYLNNILHHLYPFSHQMQIISKSYPIIPKPFQHHQNHIKSTHNYPKSTQYHP